MRFEVNAEGIRALQTALAAAAVRADAVTREATVAAASVYERSIKEELRKSSHPKRTPTPSAPGEPPSLVSGNLMRSVAVYGPTGGAGVYVAEIGPSAIYGRIQELGGVTGRGYRTQLPARPYVHPGAEKARTEVHGMYLTAWSTIL